MQYEIELKLVVYPEFVHFLRQTFSHCNIVKSEQIFLGNYYYDTADQQFAKQKMGLRVRKQNEQFTLTLKTQGETKGGLHLRPEYDLSLTEAQFSAQHLAQLSEKCGHFLPYFSCLRPHFSTDFERQYWLIECGNGTLIEIAFDQGEIVAGENKQGICEVEFELKQGKIQDLLSFVAELGFENGVRLSAASKAKRGYQLINPPSATIDWQDQWQHFLRIEQQHSNASTILNSLLQLEQRLIDETFMFGMDYFQQDFSRCVARVSAFFNLYHYYQHAPTWLSSLFVQSDYLTESDFQQFLDDNQWFLAQISAIIQLHSVTQDNQTAIQKLQELLENRQYVKRLLTLMRLVVK